MVNSKIGGKYFYFLTFCFYTVLCQGSEVSPFKRRRNTTINEENYGQNLENYGFMVQLRRMVHDPLTQEQFYCAGVIITYFAILTSASCTFDLLGNPKTLPKSFTVNYGSPKLRGKGFATPAREVIIHSEFQIETFEANMAFIYTYHLQVDSHWADLDLPLKTINILDTEIEEGKICEIVGWGFSRCSARKYSETMKISKTKILSRKTCVEAYEKFGYEITQDQICAGIPIEENVPTPGDTGGPLICDGKLAGIVSYIYECGTLPGIFTAISYHKRFIESLGTSTASTFSTYRHIFVVTQILTITRVCKILNI